MSEHISEDKLSRIKSLEALRELKINPYPNYYEFSMYSKDIIEKFKENGEQEFEASIAGRIMLLRDFGKAIFATVKDFKGNIQIYARKDVLGDEKFKVFKLLYPGDIIGVKGKVFKTHKGEITVLVEDFTILAKAINPLPEKWHGLTDVELRYRQRYVDLIVNEKVMNDFLTRFKIISFIRKYLENKGFIEVETPMMQVIPGGATARPFITHHNALNMDLYLRIAPELYLKRLLVGGFEKVFELNRNFRNEGIDTRHNPEFTMVELYQAYADYRTMMDIFIDLMKELTIHIKGTTEITYQGKILDFGKWEKLSYRDALKKYANLDTDKINTREDAFKIAKEYGIEKIESHLGKWGIIDLIFAEKVEHNLINPTIIYEYPSEISPLSKYMVENPEFVERFEAYAYGREIANAFSELNDPFVQKERFLAQAKKKAAGDDEAMFMDEDYINALEYGMPPAGGMGIGIDRLVMFLIDTNSIRDTILFPTMK